MDKKIPSLVEIIELAKQGNSTKSLQLLNAHINANPLDTTAIKFYKKLRGQIYKENLQKVKETIIISKPLWNQKKFKELLELYLKAEQFAPGYKPLLRLIDKSYKEYTLQEQAKSQNNFKKTINQVNTNLKSKKYDTALNFLLEVIAKDPNNPAYQKLLIETKRKIIDSKLRDNLKSFSADKTPEIYDFLRKLFELEPTYFKIQKLLFKYHQRLKYYYQNKQKLYVKDAIRQIHILYNKSEYQKSIKACRELLRNDPYNKIGKKFLIKNTQQIDNQNFKTAYAKLKTT